MKRAALLLSALALVLAGCATTPDADVPADGSVDQAQFLAAHDLSGMDGKEIVDHLDRVPVSERPTDLMASVRADEVQLSDAEQQETTVSLPEDEFYLSLAPYLDQTHECYYHSLTTCQGELGGEEIDVRITDDSGKVLVDEQVTTFDNGFIGFWLPADIDALVEVDYNGSTGSEQISTDADGATCVTTLHLS